MAILDRKLRLAGAGLVAVVAAIVVPVLVLGARTERRLGEGKPAPELSGKAVRGRVVDLKRLRGHIVLVSFVNFRAQLSGNGDLSLSQSTFLRSMESQHARFGLRTIIVDATRAGGGAVLSRTDVLNWTYNWNLAPPIAVLPDEEGTFARRFAVRRREQALGRLCPRRQPRLRDPRARGPQPRLELELPRRQPRRRSARRRLREVRSPRRAARRRRTSGSRTGRRRRPR